MSSKVMVCINATIFIIYKIRLTNAPTSIYSHKLSFATIKKFMKFFYFLPKTFPTGLP